MEENFFEMEQHLNNILEKLNILSNNATTELKYNSDTIEEIKNTIIEFKDILQNNKNILLIKLEKVKRISNVVYDLNNDNLFSDLTDYISNELYAFKFLLQKKLNEKEK